MAKSYLPLPFARRMKVHDLVSKRFSNVYFSSAPANKAVAIDEHALGVEGAEPVARYMLDELTCRGGVLSCRRALIKRLVWTFLVVNTAEEIEGALLSAKVCTRRISGFLFEGSMHALVPPVLLRLAGFDALMNDSKLEPPN